LRYTFIKKIDRWQGFFARMHSQLVEGKIKYSYFWRRSRPANKNRDTTISTFHKAAKKNQNGPETFIYIINTSIISSRGEHLQCLWAFAAPFRTKESMTGMEFSSPNSREDS